ncbi:MAG: acyl carrier protein [Lentisphaeria bacterium]|nr:acyl carrier protein [Lentisphaeria bacterium]
MSTIAEKVKGIVVKQLAVAEDQVTDDARFIEDLNADSLDQVELIMALEEEFNSDIPDEEAETLKTVGDAIKYIEKKQGEAAE